MKEKKATQTIPLGPRVDLTRSVRARAPIVESYVGEERRDREQRECEKKTSGAKKKKEEEENKTNELCAGATGLLCVTLDDAHCLVRLAADHCLQWSLCALCLRMRALLKKKKEI